MSSDSFVPLGLQLKVRVSKDGADAMAGRLINRAMFMLLRKALLLAAVAVSASAVASEDFVIYEDIGQLVKPKSMPKGVRPLRAIPSAQLWPAGASRDAPHADAIRRAVKNNVSPDGLVCLNIEHWRLTGVDSGTRKASIEKLKVVLEIAREAAPEARIGYYGLVPIREFYGVLSESSVRRNRWQEQNNELRPLAEELDVLFPSLYAFSHDIDDWLVYAHANIEAAQAYSKPIIPFIWPQIHQSSRAHGLEFVSYDMWKAKLELISQTADAVVIWTPHGEMRTKFSEDQEWWQATLDFVAERKVITDPDRTGARLGQ